MVSMQAMEAKGNAPDSELALSSEGNIYGTTTTGGASNLGVVFKILPTGHMTTVVSFKGTNGSQPMGGLTLGPDHQLCRVSGPVWVSGNTIRLLGPGTVNLTVLQAGNKDVLPARATQTFQVSKP